MDVGWVGVGLVLLAVLGVLRATVVGAGEDAPPAALLTVAEASDFQRTSTSAEVDALVTRLCVRAPHLRSFAAGRTVEGKPLRCVVAARPMVASAAELQDDPRLVILLLGNIHSGECAGKEALLMLLREIALHERHPWLAGGIVLFLPNYNADGNDKFGPNDERRRGQVGPVEMGTRANAQGLDLNRDFMKLESPEARALVGLMAVWNPHLFMDCHTTNGSWHRYALTYDVPHGPATPQPVRTLLRERLLPAVTRALAAQGLSTFYYGNFDRDHTRWTTYGYEPRYSTEYVGLRGRLAILSEAYSYIPYRQRILATKAFVTACIDWVCASSDDVKRAVSARSDAPAPVPLRAKVEAFDDPYVVRGFAPPVKPKTPTAGAARAKPTTPKDYSVAFWGRYAPARSVPRAYAYALPAGLTSIVPILQGHGIAVERLTAEAALEVEVSRFTSLVKSPARFQGHHLVTAQVERRTERRKLARGDFLVRCTGALATLTTHLLEPEGADSLVTWNLFDAYLKVGGDHPVLRIVAPTVLMAEPVATSEASPR